MGPALQKLLEVGGAPFLPEGPEGPDAPLVVLDRFAEIGASISSVLRQKNGFFCFESALRFFPSETSRSSWGVTDWNKHDLWKADYDGLADDIFCFAEDLFGRQFVVFEGKIGAFEPETGNVEFVASSLEQWASKILQDCNYMTGYSLGHEWQLDHGPLHQRHRLMARQPFVLGGEYSATNFASTDSLQMMKNLGNLARQIRDLPDGAQIRFKVG
ncbi:MAG TPA: hypothetical protein VKS24_02830 [Bradyrhizobium sp.]|nr:hypothetical protein [Bradyrhizobium sp.]